MKLRDTLPTDIFIEAIGNRLRKKRGRIISTVSRLFPLNKISYESYYRIIEEIEQAKREYFNKGGTVHIYPSIEEAAKKGLAIKYEDVSKLQKNSYFYRAGRSFKRCVGIDVTVKLGVPCKYPGCSKIVPVGTRFCEAHAKIARKEADLKRGTSRERGYDSRWEKIRSVKLKATPFCECDQCRGKRLLADTVHHIDRNPHNNAWGNLMSVKRECHERIHRDAGERW